MSALEPKPTRLDVNFDLFSTPVRVSAWFWIFPGVIGALSALFFGAGYLFLAPACFFVSILLHEFGHVFAGRCYGQEGYVVLNGFGGVAVGSADVADRWPRIMVFAAGPLAQLLLGGLLWAVSEPAIHLLPRTIAIREVVAYTLICLQSVSLSIALLNLVPVWPLDGWHIASEFYEQFRGRGRAPWEVDANWWKRGRLGSEGGQPWYTSTSTRGSNRLPLTILLSSVVLVFAWSQLGVRLATPTATELMQRYKNDPDRAAGTWRIWPVTFRGVLRKPPWEKALYQYEGGEEALVYFVTNNPDEWIFCTTKYDEHLAELQEGRQYFVSGIVYHFENKGNLFLARCSIRKAD